MSKASNSSVKHERGTCLTLEQYELFVAFLKHNIRPNRKSLKNAGLVGTLNGGNGNGKPKVPFARFKSISKRLTYRESDDELVFKANSKIVLPNNRFEEAILHAHTSRGNKHLNLTRTIQKLAEKYTIGCRQFGISEENVRMVIRRCHDGSCANKNKTEMGVLKHFAKTEKTSSSKTSTSNLKETSLTQAIQTDPSPASVIKFPVVNSIPMTVVKLPNGTLGIQPTSNFPGFTPLKQVPLFNTKTLAGPVSQSENPYTWNHTCNTSQASRTNIAAMMRMTPYMPYTSTENRVSNVVPIPVQLVKVGSQPLMVGQQVCLIHGGACFTNLLNAGQSSAQPLDLSKDSNMPLNLSLGASTSQSNLGLSNAKCDSNGDLSFQQDSCANTSNVIAPSKLDQNNNDVSLSGADGEDGGINGSRSQGILQQNGTGQPSTSSSAMDNFSSYGQPCNHGNSENLIDLTGSYQEDKEIFEGNDLQEDTKVRVDSTGLNGRDSSCMLSPLPYPKIWYFYNDLSKQNNPYERIAMCITDMRLDLMKSLAGSLQATERMRKKMHYIQDLITAQKNVTQYFTDLQSTV